MTSGQSTLGSSFTFWANLLIVQRGSRYTFASGVNVPCAFGYTLGFRVPYLLDHLLPLLCPGFILGLYSPSVFFSRYVHSWFSKISNDSIPPQLL